MDFEVVNSSIVNVSADAIVLPANEQLKEGSGTSRAIFEAAGRKALTTACGKIGRCDVGTATVTPAFDLNARAIVHAVVPKWIDGQSNEYELLSAAYLSALNIADYIGCESIAFPLLASGNNGFDKELAFHIAQESVRQFSGMHLRKVILVIFGEDIVALLESLGYTAVYIPDSFLDDEKKLAKVEQRKKRIAEGKEIAFKALDDATAKLQEWLKDEHHREMLLQAAATIVKLAIHAKGGRCPKPPKKK